MALIPLGHRKRLTWHEAENKLLSFRQLALLTATPPSLDYQVRDVANFVQEFVPDAKITYTGEVGADPRDYRVRFDLLDALAPGFTLDYTLRAGVEELHREYTDKGFSLEDFKGDRYFRLRVLKHRLERLKA